jgi:hypothetical protein
VSIGYEYTIDRAALDGDVRRLEAAWERLRRANVALERAAEEARKAAEDLRGGGAEQ